MLMSLQTSFERVVDSGLRQAYQAIEGIRFVSHKKGM